MSSSESIAAHKKTRARVDKCIAGLTNEVILGIEQEAKTNALEQAKGDKKLAAVFFKPEFERLVLEHGK